MKVHVTGASGFTGRHVVPRLLDAGHEVTALVRSRTASDIVTAMGATPLAGDLGDPTSVRRAFVVSRAQALVNLTSLGRGHAARIVAAAQEAALDRAVFVSTTAIFTKLESSSKATRQHAEGIIRASTLRWTIVRPTMIYGTPADRNMARLLRLVRRVPAVPLPGGGRRLQQPVHVDDVAAALVAALIAPAAIHRTYDLAGPEPLTLREVVVQAAVAMQRPPRLVAVPLRPTVAAVRLYERLVPSPRLRAEQIERLTEDKAFDIGPARRDLGFAPRSFAEGIGQEAELV